MSLSAIISFHSMVEHTNRI